MAEVYSWHNITVDAGSKRLLDNVSGFTPGGTHGGTLTALMGPSGSGKTTLLLVLARRTGGLSSFKVTGDVRYNGQWATPSLLRQVSRFVEQEDHLIGLLTVKETVDFAAKMADQKTDSLTRAGLVNDVIELLGLTKQANTKVGTPLQKGLSGGQKRRLSVASQVVTKPCLLFLDEPTSGLDSKASYEVVQTLKQLAASANMTVIASIHQPSALTYELFDNVMYLLEGRVVYSGTRAGVIGYFENAGYPIPSHHNPAEYILDLTNTDFSSDGFDKRAIVDHLVDYFAAHKSKDDFQHGADSEKNGSFDFVNQTSCVSQANKVNNLLRRSFIKARRDYLAYYVRLVMYLGLAVMMGTVWLRLGYSQTSIQPFINAIFFSGAFMSFMSVAYIPAYLEDYFAYTKERANGLYGPLPFVLSNFIIGLPFLFFISLVFAIVTYFMCNFRHSGSGFFMYVLYLFLDLVAAESLTILIATLFPVFVVSLALTAFANGLWMAVGGFLVPASVLNKFWYYTFYWVDYQRYVFQGMMFNQFKHTVYTCGPGCHCMYSSPLEKMCKIDGTAVLEALGYGKQQHGLWIGLLLALIFVLRLATYIVLRLKR
jgi:ABC-type multidrug transport system ATPase subunit